LDIPSAEDEVQVARASVFGVSAQFPASSENAGQRATEQIRRPRMRSCKGSFIGLAMLATLAHPTSPAIGDKALSPAAQQGRVLLLANCARCHAIDKVSPSPLKVAPPFRILHLRYPVENLEEPLLEGIITRHPAMPVFSFDPGQIADIIAYFKSLEH
jgi:mono/diheme cytochrome c family protein